MVSHYASKHQLQLMLIVLQADRVAIDKDIDQTNRTVIRLNGFKEGLTRAIDRLEQRIKLLTLEEEEQETN